MKLRRKISLFFSILTSCIIAVILLIVYIVETRYINTIYYDYLFEKAFITAEKFLEEDEVSAHDYSVILQKYAETMPETREYVLNIDSIGSSYDTISYFLSSQQIKSIVDEGVMHGKKESSFFTAIYYPDNEGNFIILVTAENSYGNSIQKMLRSVLLITMFLSFLLLFLFGEIYADRIFKPIKDVISQIRNIRSTSLNRKIEYKRKDELGELTHTLNTMLEELDIAFNAQKSFISNASHELNNPLTAILGECDITLSKTRSAEEYKTAIERISTETERLEKLIHELFVLAKSDLEILNHYSEKTDLTELVRNICEEFNAKFYPQRIRFESTGEIRIATNPELLRIAIRNIVDNACKYSGNKPVEIRLKLIPGNILLTVKDSGIGIPEEEIRQIFNSFYRAGNTRGYPGQGIGLALSQKIIRSHQGEIHIKSELGNYTEVIINFPV